MGGILHRTIFAELVRVFALALLGITGIIVMAGMVAEASQQGLNPSQIVAIIPLLIPSTMPYTIPATTLFAACIVYGRLAHDNEILAIKAAGIRVTSVLWPAVFVGVLTSAATMALYYRLIPYTQLLLRTQFLNEVEDYMYAMLKKDRSIKQPNLPYAIWVRQVQGDRLLDAVFKRRDKNGRYDVSAWAREARLHYDAANRQVIVEMRHCHVFNETNTSTAYFQQKEWPVPLPDNLSAQRNTRPRAMSVPELFDRRRELWDEVNAQKAEVANLLAWQLMANVPEDLPKHLDNLQNKVRQKMQDIWSVDTEIQMRPALSLGCLCFVLVGCPVGIWFSRSDYLSAFITCFLPIVFVYYPMLLCCTNLAKQGKVPAYAAVWGANAVMVLIAGVLFRRLLKN